MARKALGKGLEAIFGAMGTEVVDKSTGTAIHEIPLIQIHPNPYQPRREFRAEEIRELTQSIGDKGLLQPILLRKHGEGYQIIAGERRFRACRELGRETIPAMVRDQVSDRDMMELALIENLQRVQLNPMEEAEAYEQLINACGLTHDDLAHQLGKSRSAITNTLRLLKLEESVRHLIRDGKLTAGHGRAILQEGDPAKQKAWAEKILSDNMNVRKAEKIRGKGKGEGKKSNPNLQAFLEGLRFALGTKIELKGTDKKGTLLIHYLSKDELEQIGALIRKGAENTRSD